MLLMIIFNKDCPGPPPTACSTSQGKLALFTVTILLGLRFWECFYGNVEDMFLLSSCLEWIIRTVFGRRRATVPLSGRRRQAQLQVAEMRVDILLNGCLYKLLTYCPITSKFCWEANMMILTITTISQMTITISWEQQLWLIMLPIFPDPFQVLAATSTAVVLDCPSMQVYVPNMRLLCFIMCFIVIMRVIKKRRAD